MQKQFENKTIMIVDDQYIMRKTIKDMLSQIGYSNFIQAADEQEALTAINKNFDSESHIGLVITDWTLLDGSGLSLIHNIKSSPKLFKIPIIITNDETEEQTIQRAIDFGADGYLLRPFVPSELDQLMDMLIMKYINPTDIEKREQEAEEQFLNKHYDAAIKLLIKLYKEQPSPRIAYQISVCLENLKTLQEAEKLLLKHLDSEFLLLLRQLYKLYMDQPNQDNWENKAAVLERLIPLEWEKKSKSPLYQELYQLQLKKKKDLFGAYQTLKDARNNDRKDKKIKEKIAALETRFPMLIEEKKSNDVVNKGVRFLNDMRISMRKLRNKNKLKAHIDHLKSQLEYVPDYPDWLFELGVAYLETGKPKKAAPLIEKAVQLKMEQYNVAQITEFLETIK